MPHPNGKQHHLTTTEILARAREKRMQPWHWNALDLDYCIRPRTTAENAAIVDEAAKLGRDAEEYAGTADEVSSIEGYRLRLRAAIPCVLHPDDKTQVFDHESIEQLLELDTPALNELIEAVDRVANFTQTTAEEAEKNSGETAASSTASVSPEAAAMSTSSPTPTPSTTS
jgi:hypothetical protein